MAFKPVETSFLDPRCLLFYLSVLSCLYLTFRWISSWTRRSGSTQAQNGGGVVIQAIRLLAHLAIFGLSLSLLIGHGGSEKVINILLVVWSLYSIVLSALTLLGPKSLRRSASAHLSFIHLVAFILYIVRDLVPLAVGKESKDQKDGSLGWARFALLGVTGFLVPGLLPRGSRPWDSETSSPLAPHETASYISHAFYIFLDPLIYRAFKNPNVAFDEMPVLADNDRTKNLMEKGTRLMDPVVVGRKRSLLWGMLFIFKKQYFIMACLQTVQSINQFAGPIATNRILAALEKGGTESAVKPWVWILWLGAGPVLGSVLTEFSLYTQCLIIVRLQAILTQLVLTHSLRVRMSTVWNQPETSASSATTSAIAGPSSPSTSSSSTPASDTESITATEETASNLGDETDDDAATTATLTPSLTASSSDLKKADKESDDSKKKGDAKKDEKQEDYSGKINNFLTSDMENIISLQEFLRPVFVIVKAFIAVAFLYAILGWSALVGLGVMIICIPIPGYTSKLLMTMQRNKMKASDARLSTVNQTMNALRMIKLFAWESKAESHIAEKREAELWYIFWGALLRVCNNCMTALFPLSAMMGTYATYTLGMGGELTPSKLFSSLVIFNRLEGYLHTIFWILPELLQAKVSMDRIGEFLNNGELYDTPASIPAATDITDQESPYIRDAAFTWDKPLASPTASKTRRFRLQIEGELAFKTGRINLICGPTASGKTSLLMALLGEMHYTALKPTGGYNLPRGAGIAYAAQESWVLNVTIKDNILFGAPHDKARFDKVIYQTGLLRDLSLFSAGELTEVGEKGITLSGGQKARITLARAVYSSAKVVLLDDVLSALDVHTARWIAEKCLAGDLLKGRTVLLVTHNILLCKPIADYVISLGRNGKIVSQGTVDEALKKNTSLKADVEAEEAAMQREEEVEALEGSDDSSTKKPEAGKLIVEEEMAIGHVTWASVRLYIASLGGPIFFAVFILGCVITSLWSVLIKWFYGYWSSQYEGRKASEVRVHLYIGIGTALEVVDLLWFILFYTIFAFGGLRASRSLHQKLTKSILACTLRWLDTTPVSRVLTRFSQDVQAIDNMLPRLVNSVTGTTIQLAVYFISVIISTGWPALILGIAVATFGISCGQLYIKAQLPIKRHMSNLRAPVLGHTGAALNGLVSIRAYGAQEAYKEESLKRIDNYNRAARTYWNLNRWIALRMDSTGAVFSGVVAAYLVYGRETPAATVGFTLVLIGSFSGQLLQWVRQMNALEVQSNSIERIKDFLEIAHEPASKDDGTPPAYWPASGELHVKKLSARYSADGPEVLKNVAFSLKSGQRMGVVGRTGAGKSTIALALLRAIPTSGSVILDGIDVSQLNLSALRSNITIIPQHPELLAGTLRENLDPYGEHDDATLNDVLRAAGLHHTQDEEGGIGLDTDVSSGGSNFSHGQRQILALARAILRRSKLVILDEATAAIDHRTDRAIQESLRSEFKDASVITVAHRLQTIMDSDKILVLDAGAVVELDTPQALLRKDGGFFKGLVDGSPDKDELYAAAGL
ncbi:hypothetical protein SISSUDRAFT_1049930 [Sistotremastrum suecicum HHB10207 ss-3]|uniref:P-loop containing nucleoside triphosphate hydrolase protein n=1 Tax=Sistotremastrum suecicum HHB10207 ss-3 TaxID=1314776 RepID=A0A166BIM0_9AGAM|nr:hypothetical protein SISSUDRAFT_1049930 [Sistotremastrum suecicum HHB10207 ss-3]